MSCVSSVRTFITLHHHNHYWLPFQSCNHIESSRLMCWHSPGHYLVSYNGRELPKLEAPDPVPITYANTSHIPITSLHAITPAQLHVVLQLLPYSHMLPGGNRYGSYRKWGQHVVSMRQATKESRNRTLPLPLHYHRLRLGWSALGKSYGRFDIAMIRRRSPRISNFNLFASPYQPPNDQPIELHSFSPGSSTHMVCAHAVIFIAMIVGWTIWTCVV